MSNEILNRILKIRQKKLKLLGMLWWYSFPDSKNLDKIFFGIHSKQYFLLRKKCEVIHQGQFSTLFLD